MACLNCFDNCADTKTTDRCVEYTGADIPALGICKGDSLYEIEVIILNKLQAVIAGTGVTLSTLTINCDFINALLLNNDRTLAGLIQALVTANCTLRSLVQGIQDSLAVAFTVDAACLGLAANPTRDAVLQATAKKVCELNTSVTAISADYVKSTELCTKVTACLAASVSTQEGSKMPKFVALPYHGPLTVFNASGVGLSAFGYDKVYICNGQIVGTFVTPDYRGRTAVGANQGMPGGAMDSAVDPALAANAGYGITAGTKKGAYTHTLTVNEEAPHTHALNDPGHNHDYVQTGDGAHPSGTNSTAPRNNFTTQTSTKVTGITAASAGGGQPHNNTQPSIGCVWIMYIP